MLGNGAISETIVTIFVSIGVAVVGTGLAFGAIYLTSAEFALGDLGIGSGILISFSVSWSRGVARRFRAASREQSVRPSQTGPSFGQIRSLTLVRRIQTKVLAP